MAERRHQPTPVTADPAADLWSDDVADLSDLERAEADAVVRIALAITHGHPRAAAGCPEGYQRACQDLVLACGRGVDLTEVTPTERLDALARAERTLGRALEVAAQAPGGSALIAELAARLTAARESLFESQQRRRVRAAVTVAGVAIEPTADGPEAVTALRHVNDELTRLARAAGHPVAVDDAVSQHLDGVAPDDAAAAAGYVGKGLQLVQYKAAALLDVIEGRASDLVDDGTAVALNHRVLAGCASARLALGNSIGALTGALGYIKGMIQLLDPEASVGERIEGGVTAVGGGLTMVGQVGELAGWSAGGTVAAWGTGVGAGLLAWQAARAIIELGGGVMMGLTRASLGAKLQVMARAGDDVAAQADLVDRAGQLAEREPDPRRAAALRRYQHELAAELGAELDRFIAEFRQPPPGVLAHDWSLCVPQLTEVFGPLMAYRGVRQPGPALAASRVMLDRIEFVARHVEAITYAMAIDAPVAQTIAPPTAAE